MPPTQCVEDLVDHSSLALTPIANGDSLATTDASNVRITPKIVNHSIVILKWQSVSTECTKLEKQGDVA